MEEFVNRDLLLGHEKKRQGPVPPVTQKPVKKGEEREADAKSTPEKKDGK